MNSEVKRTFFYLGGSVVGTLQWADSRNFLDFDFLLVRWELLDSLRRSLTLTPSLFGQPERSRTYTVTQNKGNEEETAWKVLKGMPTADTVSERQEVTAQSRRRTAWIWEHGT